MKRLFPAFLSLFLLVGAGCGDAAPDTDRFGREVERDIERTDGDREGGPQDIADAVGQLFGGEDGPRVETVDFRMLRDLLPEDLEEFDRTDISGERTGMGGFKISNAEAEYRDEDDSARRLTVQITDAGGMGRMALLGAAWMQFEVDKESSEGYERTTEYEGYPAYETYRSGDRPRAELQFVVGERFFVSVEGQNVEMDDLKDAVDDLDLGDLEAMKDEGVQE